MTASAGFPRTPLEGGAVHAWYLQRYSDLKYAADLAVRRSEIARGELLIVEAVMRGEFETDDQWAQGSAGPWRVPSVKGVSA